MTFQFMNMLIIIICNIEYPVHKTTMVQGRQSTLSLSLYFFLHAHNLKHKFFADINK